MDTLLECDAEGAIATIQRLRSGEEVAWAEVATRLTERLKRYFCRLGARRHEADDLAQDVLGIVYRRIDAVRDPTRFEGWVLTIARNRYISCRRRKGNRPDIVGDAAELHDVAEPALPQADDELVLVVRQELRALPPSARRLLELRVLEGLTPTEVWHVTGVAPEQQRRRLHVALKELRRRLRVRLFGAPPYEE